MGLNFWQFDLPTLLAVHHYALWSEVVDCAGPSVAAAKMWDSVSIRPRRSRGLTTDVDGFKMAVAKGVTSQADRRLLQHCVRG